MPRDKNAKTGVNRGHADGLRDVALANAGIAEQQSVFVLLDEAAVGQLEDERSVERVELPIEGSSVLWSRKPAALTRRSMSRSRRRCSSS